MVDVGGGTLDVTVFNVHKDSAGGRRIPYFCAPRQGRWGHAISCKLAARHYGNGETWSYSPFDELPSDGKFRRTHNVSMEELKELDRPFPEKRSCYGGRRAQIYEGKPVSYGSTLG